MLLVNEIVMPTVLAFADTAHAAAEHAPTSVLLRGYLIAWLFWLGISLGSLALTWLHHLIGGKWGRAIRLELTAAGQTLPASAFARRLCRRVAALSSKPQSPRMNLQ